MLDPGKYNRVMVRTNINNFFQFKPCKLKMDASIEEDYQLKIKDAIENNSDNKISDIHIWKVAANHYAAIISLVTHLPQSTDYYKALLCDFHKLSHITIEVNSCE